MPYRFKHKEAVPESVVRIVTEQTQHAAREIRGDAAGSHDGVQNARKSLKKTRSLLRMIRGEIGDDVYRRENEWFRGVAHRLAAARDMEAMIETCDKLVERYADLSQCGLLETVREALARSRRSSLEENEGMNQDTEELAAQLERMPERLDGWNLEHDGFQTLAPGLKRSYRRGRKAFDLARKRPDDTRFHEWRKRVKDFWYHTRLLHRIWPALMVARASELKRLSDLLGDDHDLSVLGVFLRRERESLGTSAGVTACLAEQRQRELRGAAVPLGRLLYARTPSCGLDELGRSWHVWKAG
jgi:CHAD domain-containing protein